LRPYTQAKASIIAGRIETEVKNPHTLNSRQLEETTIENLLAKHRFYSQINKVYRLSNDALIVLKKRLLFTRRISA